MPFALTVDPFVPFAGTARIVGVAGVVGVNGVKVAVDDGEDSIDGSSPDTGVGGSAVAGDAAAVLTTSRSTSPSRCVELFIRGEGGGAVDGALRRANSDERDEVDTGRKADAREPDEQLHHEREQWRRDRGECRPVPPVLDLLDGLGVFRERGGVVQYIRENCAADHQYANDEWGSLIDRVRKGGTTDTGPCLCGGRSGHPDEGCNDHLSGRLNIRPGCTWDAITHGFVSLCLFFGLRIARSHLGVLHFCPRWELCYIYSSLHRQRCFNTALQALFCLISR